MTQDQIVIERLKIERDELKKEIDAMVAAMSTSASEHHYTIQALAVANELIQSQANENDKLVKQLNERISELEKGNDELRDIVVEARDGFGDIIKLVGEAQKMIAKPPDDAA